MFNLGELCWCLTEPNNDSPLNAQAAELWSNQEVYKRVLLEKYQRDTKWSLQKCRFPAGKQRLWLHRYHPNEMWMYTYHAA